MRRMVMRIARTFQTRASSTPRRCWIGGTIDGNGTFVESLLALPRHRRDEAKLRDTAMLALAAVGLERLAAVRADRLQHSELCFVEIADLLVGRCVAEAHRILVHVGQAVDPAGMDLRRVGARKQRHDRERLAGIDRTDDDAHLLAVGKLGRAVDRLGRIALGVAGYQLDLPPVDAAGIVDLAYRQLDATMMPTPVAEEGPVSAGR